MAQLENAAQCKNAIQVFNNTKGHMVCAQATLANTFSTRLFGLLGKRSMPTDAGLYITPSSGVHTFGMSMSIDIVTLDAKRRVLGTYENTGPWVVRGLSLKTRSVLELAAGRIAQCGIQPGDQLTITSAI